MTVRNLNDYYPLDRAAFLSPDGIEVLRGDGSREWIVQYLNDPPPPLAPGTYCASCVHTEPTYFDQMVPGRRGVGVPCCERRDCPCTGHMVWTFDVPITE